MTLHLALALVGLASAPAPGSAPAAKAVPAWYTSGDPERPSQLWVVGVGASRKSRESAFSSAQGALSRQIRARIRSSLSDQQVSVRVKEAGQESGAVAQKLDNRTRTESDLDLTGVQEVRSENVDGTWYSEVALDKAVYAQALEGRIRSLSAEVRTGLKSAIEQTKTGKPALAAASLARLDRVLDQIEELRALRLSWAFPLDDTLPVSRADLAETYGTVLSGLRLSVVGSNLTATAGAEWASPLQVKVEAGGAPVEGFPLSVLTGNGDFLEKTSTGPGGIASIWLPSAGAPGRVAWLVKPRLDVPANLRPVLDGMAVRAAGLVNPVPFPELEWGFDGDSAGALAPEARAALAKAGVRLRTGGTSKVTGTFRVEGLQRISGLDGTLERVAVEVVLSLEMPGRTRAAAPLRAEGFGKDQREALRKAVQAISWSPALGELSQAIQAPSGKIRKIGVVVLEAPQEGEDEALVASQLSIHLQGLLGQDRRIQVLERARLDRLYSEVTAQLAGLFETSGEVLRQSGADAVILGEVVGENGSCEVDARMVDVATGRVLSSASAKADPANLRKTAKTLAKELVAGSLE